jgi:hypothetical protein
VRKKLDRDTGLAEFFFTAKNIDFFYLLLSFASPDPIEPPEPMDPKVGGFRLGFCFYSNDSWSSVHSMLWVFLFGADAFGCLKVCCLIKLPIIDLRITFFFTSSDSM